MAVLNSISILHWNCRGVHAHINELQQHLAEASCKYDVVCLQETFLRKGKRFKMRGYTVVRRDRADGRGGGVATLVRDGINFTECDTGADIESICISLRVKGNYHRIANLYLPPEPSLTGVTVNEAQLASIMSTSTIVVGDLNAKCRTWGSHTPDPRGIFIDDLADRNGLVVVNDGSPTYTHYNGTESHLDVAMVKANLATACSWTTLQNSLGSDHLPCFLEIFGTEPEVETPGPGRYKFNKADWGAYAAASMQAWSTVNVDDDVETLGAAITDAIIDAANAAIPRSRPNGRRRKYKPLPYWSDECKKAVSDRNNARNCLAKNKGDTAKRLEYRRLKGVAQAVIKNAAHEHFRDFCGTLDRTSKMSNVWSFVKSMNGDAKHATVSNLKINGNIVDTNKAKAAVFAETFAAVSSNANRDDEFNVYREKFEAARKPRPIAVYESTVENAGVNANFATHELQRAIRECKRSTAPGEDNVSYEMLKRLPKQCIHSLLLFYNKVWSSGEMPKAWRESIVIPILKQGKDKTAPSSYRPVSLTSTLCKLMERLVKNRLMFFVESKLSSAQAGFRKGRGTIDHIARLSDCISRGINNSKHTLAVFLDFTSAFDMVWHEKLLSKLEGYGITGNCFAFIEQFLTDRSIRVRVGNETSDSFKLDNGSPQGSVLSPALFLLCIDDLVAKVRGVDCSLYADDASLYKTDKNIDRVYQSIQRNLNVVSAWCRENGFILSTNKTVAVLFTRGRYVELPGPLTIDGKEIKIEKSARFLGVIFDSRLTWAEHINYVAEKCRKRLNLLRAIAGTKWGASRKLLLMVYRGLIRSVIDYGCIAYDSASGALKAKLDVIHHRALRIAAGAFCTTSKAALEVELAEPPLALRRKKLMLNYAVKVRGTPNHPTVTAFVPKHGARALKRNGGVETLYRKTRPFLVNLKTAYQGPRCDAAARPPWLRKQCFVDTGLTNVLNTSFNDQVKRALACDVIERYGHCEQYYTDGSRHEDGRTAAAAYCAASDTCITARLTDNINIYAAELTAIRLALEMAQQRRNGNGKNIAIFSDSLSSLLSLQAGQCNSRPNLLQSVLQFVDSLNVDVHLVWVPAHCGIAGNERCDAGANAATRRASVDLDIGMELGDGYNAVRRLVLNEWQQQWQGAKTGAFLRHLVPTVGGAARPCIQNRAKDVLITRLRLGKCKLNSGLAQIKKVPNADCSYGCRSPETVEHFLIQCTGAGNPIAGKLRQTCLSLGVVHDIRTVLTDRRLIDVIVASRLDRDL
jgi:ribonuclease HI